MLIQPIFKKGFLKGPYFTRPEVSEGKFESTNLISENGYIAERDYIEYKLKEAFNLPPDHPIYIGDEKYFVPAEERIREITSTSLQHHQQYYAERFDCDDFAYVLKGEFCLHTFKNAESEFGLCAGILWGEFSWVTGQHAINWALIAPKGDGADFEIVLIEPQGDVFYNSTEYKAGTMSLILV